MVNCIDGSKMVNAIDELLLTVLRYTYIEVAYTMYAQAQFVL